MKNLKGIITSILICLIFILFSFNRISYNKSFNKNKDTILIKENKISETKKSNELDSLIKIAIDSISKH